jgi:tetratricopeptide (TPR) repeat protein
MTGEKKKMNVISFDRSKKIPDAARIAEFAATARKLLRERSAGEVVAKLLKETPREEWASLAEREEIRNSGALERLSKEMATVLDKEPADALALSALATTIAEALSADEYPAIVNAQMRAHAWKDRAQALTYVGRDQEALDAIERAEALLEPFAAVAHDRAVLRLMKAIVLQHFKEWDASLALLRQSHKVFADHHDAKRLLQCGLTEAMLLHRRHEYDKARGVLEPLLDVAREAKDVFLLAAIHHNIAQSHLELGDFIAANIHFSEAVRHFNDDGRKIEAARAEMNIGDLFLRRGQIDYAWSHLSTARSVFEHCEMHEEVAMSATLMMEAMLVRGNEAQARSIATELAKQLEGTRVSKQALEAIMYADRAIEAHDEPLAAVRHVHRYFESLRADPQRAFNAQ